MSESKEVAVGDRLWLVEARGRSRVGRAVVVSKVGRKWVQLVDAERQDWGAGRYDKATGTYDNGGYSGGPSIYGTEAEWQQSVQLAEAWQQFKRLVADHWVMPKHLTAADIRQMVLILNPARQDTPA